MKYGSEKKSHLIESINLFCAQNSLTLRTAFESWNKKTQVWLRRTAYDRNGRYKLLWVYLLSSVWHGWVKLSNLNISLILILDQKYIPRVLPDFIPICILHDRLPYCPTLPSSPISGKRKRTGFCLRLRDIPVLSCDSVIYGHTFQFVGVMDITSSLQTVILFRTHLRIDGNIHTSKSIDIERKTCRPHKNSPRIDDDQDQTNISHIL